MTLFMLGVVCAWFLCTWYHYSQDAIDETANGAMVIGVLLVAILIVVGIFTTQHIILPALDATPTPTFEGR